MKTARVIFATLPLLMLGCQGSGSTTIAESPADWLKYSGQTVTVRGNAGNSNRGPIVRFEDGGYIALLSREPWSFDERGRMIAGRPVEVTGRIVSGEGFRAEKVVLEIQSFTLIAPEAATPKPASP